MAGGHNVAMPRGCGMLCRPWLTMRTVFPPPISPAKLAGAEGAPVGYTAYLLVHTVYRAACPWPYNIVYTRVYSIAVDGTTHFWTTTHKAKTSTF